MKKQKFLLVIICLAVTAFAFSVCQKNTAENIQIKPQTLPAVSPTSISSLNSKESDSKSYSTIREVDFKNFTYPWTEDQGGDGNFALENGKKERLDKDDIEATFETVEYGDVTNDGEEEAFVSIYPYSGGNCQCIMVFIYTLENKQPKLLWSFDTFDKAVGGFKKAYADGGELVVETFGDNNFENGKWKFSFPENKFRGFCCPTVYTKIRFKWNGEKFVEEGERELFDYDDPNNRK